MDVSSAALYTICSLSTVALRLASYVFLRWVFPPFIFTAFGIYASIFTVLYLSKSAYKVAATSSTVIVTQPNEIEITDNGETTGLLKKPPPTIEATETIVYEKKDPHPVRTLLFGLPSPSNGKLSLITFGINALLALATWDLTFRSHYFYQEQDLSFSRIGYVGPDSAKLLIREPIRDRWPVTVWYSLDEPIVPETHLVDIIPALYNETDFTKTITIKKLHPETKYRYFTSSNHTGTFTTAPAPGARPKGGKFTFLTTSCIKQRFPYNPLAHPLSIKGFKIISSMLEELQASFMLFLGDFIYIDVPRRPGTDVESYRLQYRQVYGSPDWPPVGNHLPWLHVGDDHEIANDWDQGKTGVYNAAMDPYLHYQHGPNPPAVRQGGETYYHFSWGSSASFFMLDTRTYRSGNNLPDGPGKSMLGTQQREDLINWLLKDDGVVDHNGDEVQWKIIVSSVPFTKNWHFGENDTWAGFLWERQQILEAAWSIGGRSGVVILSGDRHEFAATKFPPPEGSRWAKEKSRAVDVHEFSCSPLNQFYLPVRTYKQVDDEDVVIKYIPDGNHKFGAITIDTTNEEQAVLKYRLFVDGEETWSWVLAAPAAGKKASMKKKLKQWA
ncbi:Similar to Alkaline phosphatase D; acc. no. P42251 [Pyronema omphalodes CBS 100304]|uniref:Similar to Alkaline phosphatase D acc. no. P42251 n=1 Tax=Pyronema omphalodes (strain CBS 100304) TaxID=1076935 RepID=U4L1M3_PYROM|nr:Similar to Alkaline phosphatase D; acc. no. P42251 [Pyronema omphalodes CBS 100304]